MRLTLVVYHESCLSGGGTPCSLITTNQLDCMGPRVDSACKQNSLTLPRRSQKWLIFSTAKQKKEMLSSVWETVKKHTLHNKIRLMNLTLITECHMKKAEGAVYRKSYALWAPAGVNVKEEKNISVTDIISETIFLIYTSSVPTTTKWKKKFRKLRWAKTSCYSEISCNDNVCIIFYVILICISSFCRLECNFYACTVLGIYCMSFSLKWFG